MATDPDIAEGWYELDIAQRGDALKATVTVPEVAMLIGLEPDGQDKIRSPWNPEERTPSCHLYDDHFYDYSTGKGGDIFDLVMALNPGTTMSQAIEAIRKRAVRAGKQYGDVEVTEPRQIVNFGPDMLQHYELDIYLGMNVQGYGIRTDDQGNVYVPHSSPEVGTYAVKVRWKGGGKSAWAGSQPAYRLYDPFGWSIMTATKNVILCEGESDAWAIQAAMGGLTDVLALPSGVGTWRDHWLDDLKPYDTIYICTDNDKAGLEGRDKLLRKIGYARAEVLKVPQLFNDAREAVAAGWIPFA